MTITFYKNKSAPNVVPKEKERKFHKSGTLKNNTSVKKPVIQLKVTDYAQIKQCNYCYIEDFSRYYYIDDINIVNAIVEIPMTVDVLESYKEDTLNSTQIISRQESIKNRYIVDDRLPIHSDCSYTTHDINIPQLTCSKGGILLQVATG